MKGIQPQNVIGLLIHTHDRLELVLDLLCGAVNMGIVHAHTAHSNQPADRARIFEAIDLTVLSKTQR